MKRSLSLLLTTLFWCGGCASGADTPAATPTPERVRREPPVLQNEPAPSPQPTVAEADNAPLEPALPEDDPPVEVAELVEDAGPVPVSAPPADTADPTGRLRFIYDCTGSMRRFRAVPEKRPNAYLNLEPILVGAFNLYRNVPLEVCGFGTNVACAPHAESPAAICKDGLRRPDLEGRHRKRVDRWKRTGRGAEPEAPDLTAYNRRLKVDSSDVAQAFAHLMGGDGVSTRFGLLVTDGVSTRTRDGRVVSTDFVGDMLDAFPLTDAARQIVDGRTLVALFFKRVAFAGRAERPLLALAWGENGDHQLERVIQTILTDAAAFEPVAVQLTGDPLPLPVLNTVSVGLTGRGPHNGKTYPPEYVETPCTRELTGWECVLPPNPEARPQRKPEQEVYALRVGAAAEAPRESAWPIFRPPVRWSELAVTLSAPEQGAVPFVGADLSSDEPLRQGELRLARATQHASCARLLQDLKGRAARVLTPLSTQVEGSSKALLLPARCVADAARLHLKAELTGQIPEARALQDHIDQVLAPLPQTSRAEPNTILGVRQLLAAVMEQVHELRWKEAGPARIAHALAGSAVISAPTTQGDRR